jgi:hypothetical protein
MILFYAYLQRILSIAQHYENCHEEPRKIPEVCELLYCIVHCQYFRAKPKNLITRKQGKHLIIFVDIFSRHWINSLLHSQFKVNIRNICYQLISTFDDKTRKHVYRVADETTQEVYNELFGDLHRK